MFFLNLLYIYLFNPILGILCIGSSRGVVDGVLYVVNSVFALLQIASGTTLLCVNSYYTPAHFKMSAFMPNYCSICGLKVPVRTQHCLICGRCIEGYDHHCLYFNKCIGSGNYKAFWFNLIAGCVQSLYFAGFCITQLVFHERLRAIICSAILLPLSLFAAFYSSYMIVYHTYLVRRGLTTYQVI